MSKVQMLRALVKQRLTAAAEDIFDLFERTIAEYEETLCRSKEENERQRRLLDAVFNPQLRLHRADVQQLLVITGEVPPEQQQQEEWSPSLDQEDPPEPPHIKEEQEEVQTGQDVDPPQIKEEQEEVWTCQEGEQLQGLEEMKVEEEEDDEEKPQSSQLHEQMETEADGEDCGGPEPAGKSHPDTYLIRDTKDQAEDRFEGEDNGRYNSCEKQLSCSVCSKQFNKTSNLKTHMRTHTGEKPFSCSVCGKKFAQKPHLQKHFRSHTGEKPFSCSVCGKRFAQNGHLQNHFRCHTGEKPFSCSLCDKCFSRYEHLQLHMRTHTGEKPVSCKVCNKRFTWPCQLRTHNCVGNPSGYNSCKKILKCSVCGRQFNKTSNLKRHMSTHLNRWKQKLMERTVEDQNQPGTHIQIGFSDMDRLGPVVDTEVFDTDRV